MAADKGPMGLAGALGVDPEEGDDVEASADEDYEAAKLEAGAAVQSAMKTGDAQAFTSALADFVKLCM